MRPRLVASLLCLSVLSTGCASIVSKSHWPVTVTSDPPGQSVTVRNEEGSVVHSGTTPFTVTLPASNGFFGKMDYTLEGPHGTVPMDASLNFWYFGNIIFGGLIGILIVDPLTGAMWTLPDECSATPHADAEPAPVE
jgi:hypothetical protein